MFSRLVVRSNYKCLLRKIQESEDLVVVLVLVKYR